jgi:hypothetical protein
MRCGLDIGKFFSSRASDKCTSFCADACIFFLTCEVYEAPPSFVAMMINQWEGYGEFCGASVDVSRICAGIWELEQE